MLHKLARQTNIAPNQLDIINYVFILICAVFHAVAEVQ